MKILYIGDTVAHAGRTIVRTQLKDLQQQHSIDITILNCENVAPGNGVTPQMADELLDWGVDGIMTDRPTLLEKVLAERRGPGKGRR